MKCRSRPRACGHERTGRELKRVGDGLSRRVVPLRGGSGRGACVVRARRRWLTAVSRDRRGSARVGHESRVPAVESPPVAAVASDALPLKRGRAFGFPKPHSRSISDRRLLTLRTPVGAIARR